MSAGAEPDANMPRSPDRATTGPISRRLIVEFGVVVLLAVGLAVLLRTVAVETFYIPSVSMSPTLAMGDRIVVDKLSYDLHAVHRGDIVVFARPPTEDCGGPPVADLVKRVVGLPGETVNLDGHGNVEIDGRRLDEAWLPSSDRGQTYPGPGGTPFSLARPYTVPANEYFVMGDNRGNSCDSRFWGPITRSEIVGKVDLRIWPLSSLTLF